MGHTKHNLLFWVTGSVDRSQNAPTSIFEHHLVEGSYCRVPEWTKARDFCAHYVQPGRGVKGTTPSRCVSSPCLVVFSLRHGWLGHTEYSRPLLRHVTIASVPRSIRHASVQMALLSIRLELLSRRHQHDWNFLEMVRPPVHPLKTLESLYCV